MKLKFVASIIALFFVCSNLIFGQGPEITVLLAPAITYGPYFNASYPQPTETPIIITSTWEENVTGKLRLSIYKSGILYAETDVESAQDVTIPSLSTFIYPLTEIESFDESYNFYNETFHDDLVNGVLVLDSTYYQVAVFEYTVSGINHFSNVEVQQIQLVPTIPLNISAPEDNDLYSVSKSEVRFVWEPVTLINGSTPVYNFKLVEVLTGQTPNDAYTLNTPIIETSITGENSYSWNRALDSIIITIDSTFNFYKKYAWGVKSILPSSFDPIKFNNFSGVKTFSFDKILPSFFCPTCDSTEIIFSNLQKGFPLELVEALTTGALDPTGVSRIPLKTFTSYKAPSCESGDPDDFEGWTGNTGSIDENTGIVINRPGIDYNPTEFFKSNHFIVDRTLGNNGLDPNVGISMVPDGGGDFAIRLGNLEGNGGVANLVYNFMVTQDNENFQFMYAVVLEDKTGHPPISRPRFSIFIEDLTANEVLKNITLTANDPGSLFQPGPGEFVFRDWDCMGTDFSGRIGNEIRVSFLVSDCGFGNHIGYCYIDGLCNNLAPIPQFTIADEFCIDDDLLGDGTSSAYETEYYWGVEECDAQGNGNASTFKWEHSAGNAGVKNIKEMYTSLGGTWKCDQNYNIYLYVNSACASMWINTKTQIYVKPCLEANAGPDQLICTNNPQNIYIGTIYNLGQIPVGTTFSWSPTTGLSNPNAALTEANPTATTEYTVTVTHPSGCVTSDKVTLTVEAAPDFSFLSDNGLCNRKISVKMISKGGSTPTFSWTPGGSTSNEVTFSYGEPSSYWASVTNTCGTTTKNIITPQIIGGNLQAVKLIYGNAVSFNSNVNDKLIIFDNDVELGNSPSYSATLYEFNLYSRDGEFNIAKVSTRPINENFGYQNGEIIWDGRVFGGKKAQDNVYNWRIKFKNCTTDKEESGWTQYVVKVKRRYFIGPFPGVYKWVTDSISDFPVTVIN